MAETMAEVLKGLGEQLAEALKKEDDTATTSEQTPATPVDHSADIKKLNDRIDTMSKQFTGIGEALTKIAEALAPEGAVSKAIATNGDDIAFIRDLFQNDKGEGILPRLESLEKGTPVQKSVVGDDSGGADEEEKKTPVNKGRNKGGVDWNATITRINKQGGVLREAVAG